MQKIRVSSSDIALVEYQLNRKPITFLGVTVRCGFKSPAVIAQDPFFTRGKIFPTTHYLTCPKLVKFVARLESSQFFKDLKASVRPGSHLNDAYLELMGIYQRALRERIFSLYKEEEDGHLSRNYEIGIFSSFLPPSDPENDADNNNREDQRIAPEFYGGLLKKGLGGSECITAVKCIHALYAFLLSFGDNDNPAPVKIFKSLIEDEIAERWPEEFPEVVGRAIKKA